MNSGEHHKTLLRTLIEATGLSRRKAFAAIREGRVSAGGRIVTDPSSPFPGGELALDGRPLAHRRAPKVYLLLHKPAGYLSAVSDQRGRSTVLDLVPVELRVPGLHPVGRLDRDTTGLLLLTNDGDFTQRLTHPSHLVEKEYWLSCRPRLSEAALDALRRGIEVDGRLRVPADVRRLPPATGFEIAITLREGRKRQVRRMVEAVGAKVLKLKRVREGALTLEGLPEGQVRELAPEEVTAFLLEGAGPRTVSAGAKASQGREVRRRSPSRPRPPRPSARPVR
ncbi:MAG TPA: pseudouridine synthase [Dehalococcoidia bacterium]|nr:pseudouridine synthase [Dehalococcoidia bacterium]